MNELLFKFIADSFCTKKATILEMNLEVFSIKAELEGDIFDLSKHSVGTEVKAITYSNMQIIQSDNKVDLFVIVDI
jgi:SHS2 domain-containing protein